jgi:hypothetical protein
MTAGHKKLLQTFERMNGGVNGYAVSLQKDGIENVLVAAERGQVEHAAKLAGLGEVEMDRIQSVAVLPRCSVLDEVKGD